MKTIISVFLFLILFFAPSCNAKSKAVYCAKDSIVVKSVTEKHSSQVKRVRNVSTRYENRVIPSTVYTTKERFAFRTNALQWLVMVPNFAIEYDVSNSIYNKWAIALEGSINAINTTPTFEERYTWKWMGGKVEARRYFRSTHDVYGNMRKNFNNKKWWNTYYWGAYVSYDVFAFRLWGKNGYKGKAPGAGLSAGWNIPLYQMPHVGCIDLDLGVSVGGVLAKYDRWEQTDGNRFQYVESVTKVLPVISDLRLSLVYRFKSAQEKYKEFDQEKIKARQEHLLDMIRLRTERLERDSIRRDSLQVVKTLNKKIKAERADSIATARKLAVDLKKKQKAAAKKQSDEENK